MKKLAIILLCGMVFPFGVQAQLSKLMSRYHEKNGVTVTQLDKSLYGLYQRDHLPAEAVEMLQQLDEVNSLNINLETCPTELSDKIISQFREILHNPSKYKLVKSWSEENDKQLIYTHTKDGKVTDLVVWNQSPAHLDIIELRGDLQLDKVALLARALNVHGLSSLNALSSDPSSFRRLRELDDYDWQERLGSLSRNMQEMAEKMREKFGKDEGQLLEDMFGSFGDSFDKMSDAFGLFGDQAHIMSNAVQITEENGKTKIKIDSKNSSMSYVIDGREASKDSVQMPSGILNVNIIPSKTDMRKSYLFITSKDKIGEFNSFKDGVLTFTCNQQTYKYNLDKVQEPILVINGRLSDRFDINPSDILQIRPLSQIEKEAGYYPTAEVIINTK